MANWPTHRARRPIRKARHRWQLRRNKQERNGANGHQGRTRAAAEREPIPDHTWEYVHRSTSR